MSARPVVSASRPKLAHLDIAKRTALLELVACLGLGPMRGAAGQRRLILTRRFRLQVLFAPQLPWLASGHRAVNRCRRRRKSRLRPATRALRLGSGGELVGSFTLSRPPRLAPGWRGGLGRECLGHVSGRGIARLLVVRCRTAGLDGRPQHNRTIDQIGFEPVATVQPKLLANGGWQRNPTVVVELDRRHESGLSGMLQTRRKRGCLPGALLAL